MLCCVYILPHRTRYTAVWYSKDGIIGPLALQPSHCTMRESPHITKGWCIPEIMLFIGVIRIKQRVAITGRNRTGPPCSVGRPTAHAPGGRPARRYRRQTPTDDDDRHQRLLLVCLYTMCRRASNKYYWFTRTAGLYYKQKHTKVSVELSI